MKGRHEQALGATEDCFEHYGPEVKKALARGYAEGGYPAAMRRAADLLGSGLRGVYVSPLDVFSAYLLTGQKDLALEWLAKGVDARDPNVYGAVKDRLAVDSLGKDPRFREVLRRTRLPC